MHVTTKRLPIESITKNKQLHHNLYHCYLRLIIAINKKAEWCLTHSAYHNYKNKTIMLLAKSFFWFKT